VAPLGRREAPAPARSGCGCVGADGVVLCRDAPAPAAPVSDSMRGMAVRSAASDGAEDQGDMAPLAPASLPPRRDANVTCRTGGSGGGIATDTPAASSPSAVLLASGGIDAVARAARLRRSISAAAASAATPATDDAAAAMVRVRLTASPPDGDIGIGIGVDDGSSTSTSSSVGGGSAAAAVGIGGGAALGGSASPQQNHAKPQPVSAPASQRSSAAPSASVLRLVLRAQARPLTATRRGACSAGGEAPDSNS
jgi:hypothetical protein